MPGGRVRVHAKSHTANHTVMTGIVQARRSRRHGYVGFVDVMRGWEAMVGAKELLLAFSIQKVVSVIRVEYGVANATA